MQYVAGRARPILNRMPTSIYFSFRRPTPLPRSVYASRVNNPHRAYSNRPNYDPLLVKEMFNYTSGRWLVNDELRHAERRREFNILELIRLAAESVGRSADDLRSVSKLAEGGFNRLFKIVMNDGFQMVARIPYPFTVPKFYSIASEVATMRFLRSHGLPIPEVYDYSPSPDNAAETEYIFMEYVHGTNLRDLWMDLEEPAMASVLRQLVQLESRMMEITFPAGGSLYYTEDLKKMGGKPGIPLEDERFCVGVQASPHTWYGKRSQLDLERGPYRTIEETLFAPAHNERAYLERFGRPRQPARRLREACGFKEQLPTDHLKNLDLYLRLAPSLIPDNPASHRFHICHPNLRPDNIIVSTSPGPSEPEVMSLINWQFASILPQFLHAGIPGQLYNHDDLISYLQSHILELVAEKDSSVALEELQANQEYHREFIHSHYIQYSKEYNKAYHDAIVDPVCLAIRHLFHVADRPWMGDPFHLEAGLMLVTIKWEEMMGKDVPCPIKFKQENLDKTEELLNLLDDAEALYEDFQSRLLFRRHSPYGSTWVPHILYDYSKWSSGRVKECYLAERAQEAEGSVIEKLAASWPLDDSDMDSDKMEYE